MTIILQANVQGASFIDNVSSHSNQSGTTKRQYNSYKSIWSMLTRTQCISSPILSHPILGVGKSRCRMGFREPLLEDLDLRECKLLDATEEFVAISEKYTSLLIYYWKQLHVVSLTAKKYFAWKDVPF